MSDAEPNILETMRTMINKSFAHQLLNERMIAELYYNFSQTRPDPEDVIERLLGRLRHDVEESFSGGNLHELHEEGIAYIDLLRDLFAGATTANNSIYE